MKDIPEGQEKIDALNTLARELFYLEPERAMTLSEDALQLCTQGEFDKHPYQKGLAESYLNMGRSQILEGDCELGLDSLYKALSYYENSQSLRNQIEIKNWTGYAYLCREDYVQALNNFTSAMQSLEVVNEPLLKTEALTNFGSLFLELDQPVRALIYLDQGLQLSRYNGQLNIQAEVLRLSCRAHNQLGDNGNAVQSGLLSLRLFSETGNQRGEAQALINLGEVYLTLNELDLALQSFQKALDIAHSRKWNRIMAESMAYVGVAYFHQDALESAYHHLNQTKEIATQISEYRTLATYHQYMSLIENQRENYIAAFEHLQQSVALKERRFLKKSRGLQEVLEALHQEEISHKETELHKLKSISLQEEVHIRKRAEEELSKANQRLRQEIQEREILIAELDTFAHMVAHDLKSPLQSMITSISLLNRILPDQSDLEMISALKTLDKSTNKMNRIIDELLVLSGVRKQEVDIKPLNMAEIISEAKTRLAYMIEHNQAQLVIPDEWPQALGYAPWVEEIWDNYISNAIKYGGKPPYVEIGATILDNGFTSFWVKDNGNGIHKEEQDKIFVEFTRLDRVRVRGHGLGLAIVKRIVEKLGGEVGLISAGLPGRGCIFSFTLPSAQQTE